MKFQETPFGTVITGLDTEINKIGQRGSEVIDDYERPFYEEMAARIAALEAELDEIKRSHAEIMAEPCESDDRVHCTCVPVLRERITGLAAENKDLKEWKRQVLEVEKSWDAQAVAKMLGILWGQDIRKHIQPKIETLIADNEQLRGLLWRINSLSRAIVNRGKYDSPHTTYGKLKKVVAEVDAALRREG